MFRNISAHGKVDVVGIKDGLVTYFNVKFISGNFIPYGSSGLIKLLIVRPTGECFISEPRQKRAEDFCEYCGKTYLPRTHHQRYCGRACHANAAAANIKPLV